MHKTAELNRTRYTLLSDRRRALFELHKLTEAVRTHSAWPEATATYAGLAGMIDDQFVQTSGALCHRACQASPQVLAHDISRLYLSLAAVAKVWAALEDERDLEPLVAAYYEAF